MLTGLGFNGWVRWNVWDVDGCKGWMVEGWERTPARDSNGGEKEIPGINKRQATGGGTGEVRYWVVEGRP